MPDDALEAAGGEAAVANGEQKISTLTQAIRSIVGLLVAGFAGSLNFIGLKNGEVPIVLRNEARTPTLILCLIVAAILTAVASIFVSPKWAVSIWAWLATACALVATVALTIQLTKIPGIPTEKLISLPVVTEWFGIAAGVLFLIAMISANWPRNLFRCIGRYLAKFIGWLMEKVHVRAFMGGLKDKIKGSFIGKATGDFKNSIKSDFKGNFKGKFKVSAQGLLVFAAVALTATATYGALRAETVSQVSNTSVQLSAAISETGRTASVIMSIDAAKMRDGDRVNVLVAGLRRRKNIAKFCKQTPIKANLPCSWAPCFTRSSFSGYLHLPPGCDAISSGIYQPNAAGTVQQTVTIPVSDVRYRGLELIGVECVVKDPNKLCTYGTTYDRNITRVDIQIPKKPAS
jgi:hypothetical protein